jgi:hypothetical protein
MPKRRMLQDAVRDIGRARYTTAETTTQSAASGQIAFSLPLVTVEQLQAESKRKEGRKVGKRGGKRGARVCRSWCYHCRNVVALHSYDYLKITHLQCPSCHCWHRVASVTDDVSVDVKRAEGYSKGEPECRDQARRS